MDYFRRRVIKAKMEKIEKNLVKLEVTVEAAKFDEAIKRAYKKNVKILMFQDLEKESSNEYC